MNPFDTFLFLVFVLPVVMIKDGWRRITKNMTKEEKKKFLWNIPYVLLIILIILMIILWLNGYR